MSNVSTTLYRFRIDLSDIDRGVYQQLDFRVAKHPSESDLYLLTRVLAYLLQYEPGIEFSKAGLGDPDGPAMLRTDERGGIDLWIEIGNPSAKKMHRASKASARVKVYTYKDPQMIVREALTSKIYQVEQIEVFPIDSDFLERLAKDLPRDVRWQVLRHDGLLSVSVGEHSEQTEIKSLMLSKNGF